MATSTSASVRGPSTPGDLSRRSVLSSRAAERLQTSLEFPGIRKDQQMIDMVGSKTEERVRDRRIERVEPLVPPAVLLDELPLADDLAQVVLRGRAETHAILDGVDDRLLVVVGPCSVHDVEATLEYAERLAEQAARLRDEVM